MGAETFLRAHPEAARSESTLRLLKIAEHAPECHATLTKLLTGVPVPVPPTFTKPPDHVAEHVKPATDEEKTSLLPSHLKHLERFATIQSSPTLSSVEGNRSSSS